MGRLLFSARRHTWCQKEIGMLKQLTRILRDENGATAIEYGLIAALIAVAIITAVGTVGSHLSSTFNSVASSL